MTLPWGSFQSRDAVTAVKVILVTLPSSFLIEASSSSVPPVFRVSKEVGVLGSDGCSSAAIGATNDQARRPGTVIHGLDFMADR
jgi:hypothetical protein